MRTTEIQTGQNFWHNGTRYVATSDAMPRDENWVVVWTTNDDGEAEALVLHRNGNVLPA